MEVWKYWNNTFFLREWIQTHLKKHIVFFRNMQQISQSTHTFKRFYMLNCMLCNLLVCKVASANIPPLQLHWPLLCSNYTFLTLVCVIIMSIVSPWLDSAGHPARTVSMVLKAWNCVVWLLKFCKLPNCTLLLELFMVFKDLEVCKSRISQC